MAYYTGSLKFSSADGGGGWSNAYGINTDGPALASATVSSGGVSPMLTASDLATTVTLPAEHVAYQVRIRFRVTGATGAIEDLRLVLGGVNLTPNLAPPDSISSSSVTYVDVLAVIKNVASVQDLNSTGFGVAFSVTNTGSKSGTFEALSLDVNIGAVDPATDGLAECFVITQVSEANQVNCFSPLGDRLWQHVEVGRLTISRITSDDLGNCFVSFPGSGLSPRIRAFDVNGEPLWVAETNSVNVFALAAEPNGSLVYASFNNFYRLNALTGAQQATTSIPMTYPRAIALDTQGNMYLADLDSVVKKFSPTGSLIWSSSNLNDGGIYGLAVDRQNNVYVCGSSRLFKINSSGTSILWTHTLFGASGIQFDIALDGSGNVYVRDNVNRILKVSPSGQTLKTKTLSISNTGTSQIRSVAVDEYGFCYVCGDGGTAKLTSDLVDEWSTQYTKGYRIATSSGDFDPGFWTTATNQLMFGAAAPSNLMLGSQSVARVYRGTTLVWET